MYSIRSLRASDKEDVRHICIETASASATDTPLKRAVLCDLYCDYYVDYATDTSFVAADGDDRAIGYVFCAPDYREYEKNYRKYLLPVLRKHKFSRAVTKNLELIFERKLSRGMPAHLHIDILPEAQRQGIGHRLMNALMFRLKELGVPKVYLVVGSSNVKGVSFYEKYGFGAVRELPGSRQYAIDVEEKCAELESRGVASEAERLQPQAD